MNCKRSVVQTHSMLQYAEWDYIWKLQMILGWIPWSSWVTVLERSPIFPYVRIHNMNMMSKYSPNHRHLNTTVKHHLHLF